MARGVELEGAAAHVQIAPLGSQLRRGTGVDTDAREHTGELLHVLLRVATVHAQCVQLHQLTGVVLVDVADGVLAVVEVLQHGRVFKGREHQVTKPAERVRPNRPLLVVGDEPAQVRFVLEDTEVVQPEPHHLFTQLRWRVHRPQQLEADGPIGGLAAFIVEQLARLILVRALGHCGDGLAPLLQLLQSPLRIGLVSFERLDLRGDRRRQLSPCAMQLLLEIAFAPEPA